MVTIGAFCSVALALMCVGGRQWQLQQRDAGNQRMVEIAGFIREGAKTFLKREYQILAVVAAVLAVSLLVTLGWPVMVAFIVGAVFSATAGLIGMMAATTANVRATQAATRSLNEAMQVGFSSGTVLGTSVVALGLLGIVTLLQLFDPTVLFGMSFGASTVALFARVGGGIYTKSADMAADLVGKVECDIPEDDPRNPAVIADNVGDNVGDVAGMGADLFESYVGCLVSAIVLGSLAFGTAGMQFPIALATTGILASLLGAFAVRTKEGGNVHHALRNGLWLSNALFLGAAWFLSNSILQTSWAFVACVIGAVAGMAIGALTEYFTSTDHAPTRSIASHSETGAATNIIQGLAVGMGSTTLPLLVIAVAIWCSYAAFAFYGVALAAVGMLSTLGMSLAIDAFGPAVDNAGGIAQMAKLPEEVRQRTDALDAVGNTTAAIGKGFAIGSAALTALTFFFTFSQTTTISLDNPDVMIGLLIGAAVPYLFCSLTIRAVSDSAFAMIREIRRQFAADPGILAGKTNPNYSLCIDIATQSALKQMLPPGLIAIATPIAIQQLLGNDALGGCLAGALSSGVLLAIALANSGGAWDNAKKLIESGAYGGKGSAAHKAAVTGDTVGDPLKDTSGPSLNILIKLMSIVALLLSGQT